jgi:hypothetical protein
VNDNPSLNRREALLPETRHGANAAEAANARWNASCQVGDTRFTKETAARTGRSERDVQRDADRGGKIAEEFLDAELNDDAGRLRLLRSTHGPNFSAFKLCKHVLDHKTSGRND